MQYQGLGSLSGVRTSIVVQFRTMIIAKLILAIYSRKCTFFIQVTEIERQFHINLLNRGVKYKHPRSCCDRKVVIRFVLTPTREQSLKKIWGLLGKAPLVKMQLISWAEPV